MATKTPPADQATRDLAVKHESPIDRLKKAIGSQSVQEQFKNALKENSALFCASLIDLYATDSNLQKCEPALVIMEALKAATLNLPINKSLGFAWIIPRWNTKAKAYTPQFQPGWKGIVQLAQRTCQYRFINCGEVYEGELRKIDKLTGELDIYGDRTGDKITGFFAYIELLNGFKKAMYWKAGDVEKHAIRYNPECKKEGKLTGVWKEHFDSRAMATVLKHLIMKYGVMSVEMADIFTKDDDSDYEVRVQEEIEANANQKVIDLKPSNPKAPDHGAPTEMTEAEKQQAIEEEQQRMSDPDAWDA